MVGKTTSEAVGKVEFSALIYAYYADDAERFLANEPVEPLGSSPK